MSHRVALIASAVLLVLGLSIWAAKPRAQELCIYNSTSNYGTFLTASWADSGLCNDPTCETICETDYCYSEACGVEYYSYCVAVSYYRHYPACTTEYGECG